MTPRRRWPSLLSLALLFAAGTSTSAHAAVPNVIDSRAAFFGLPQPPSTLEQLELREAERAACGVFCGAPMELDSVVELGSTKASVRTQDAWGAPRDASELEASKNRFGFTGHLYDAESELVYAKARYFDPDFGRFLTQDSYLGELSEPPSIHRYAYAYDNPTRYVDPTGNFTEEQLKRLDEIERKRGRAAAIAEAAGAIVTPLASDHRPAYEKSWARNFAEELYFQVPTRALPMRTFEGLAQQDLGKIALGMVETAGAAVLGVVVKIGGRAVVEKLVERVPVLGREVGGLVTSGARRAREALTGLVREGERLLSAEVTVDPSVVSMGGLGGVRLKVPPRAGTTAATEAPSGVASAERLLLEGGGSFEGGPTFQTSVRAPSGGRSVGQQQGREFRTDWLEVHEFDPKVPRHVRGWLKQERHRVEAGRAAAPRNPPGQVMAHGRTSPAREGFDYSNARLQDADLNALEEVMRRRQGKQ